MNRVNRRSVLVGIGAGIAACTAPRTRALDVATEPTAAERAAGVTPGDARYPPGDVRRYGAVLDGSTDDTAALRRWARVGGELRFPVAQTARISAAIPLASGTQISAVPGATIESSAADASLFTATEQHDVSVRGLHLRQLTAGTHGYVAGVLLDRCTRCRVEGCEFEGMQWAGVYLLNSSRCEIRDNRFHGWQGSVQDASDVCIHRNSSENTIDGNQLLGGGNHGVLCQDPYAGEIPTKNVISNNHVGEHTGYGIAVYMPGKGSSGNSDNQVRNNTVENIQGSFAKNRSSGAGIYVVGAWAGGTEVIGNHVSNCCVQSQVRSLAPAGIGVNGISAGVQRPRLANNTISGMTQGDGMLIVSSPGGADISGGSIDIPARNDGHGPGGAVFLGSGVRIENSSAVIVDSVDVVVHGPGNALFVFANGAGLKDVAITGGSYRAEGAGAAVRTAASPSQRIENFRAAKTTVTAAGAAPGLVLASLTGAELSGVAASAAREVALHVNASTGVHVSGGKLHSGGPTVVRATGDCSGGSVDGSVDWGGAPHSAENRAQGFRIE
jgi:parallel beta-helix repeat protein